MAAKKPPMKKGSPSGMTPAMQKQVDAMMKKGMPRSMAMMIVKKKASGKKAPAKKNPFAKKK